MSSKYVGLAFNFQIDGSHSAAWRHPSTDLEKLYSIAHLRDTVKRLEEHHIDVMFLTDHLAFHKNYTSAVKAFEPVSLGGYIAALSRRLGIVATISTTFTEPYNTARYLSALDRLSEGRAGWNIVTSGHSASGANFGLAGLPQHENRYARGREHVTVVKKLLTSFEQDALVMDRQSGSFVDLDKVHALDHAGDYYQVAGPLPTFRSPQVWPIMWQAGASPDGKRLAVQHAEAVYSFTNSFEHAVEEYADLKAKLADAGRDPDSLKVFKGLFLHVEQSRQQALDVVGEVDSLANSGDVMALRGKVSGIDLSQYAPTDPIPELPPPATSNNYQTLYANVLDAIKRENLTTVGQLIERLRGSSTQRAIGSPTDIADTIERLYVEQGADGITFGPILGQRGLTNFLELVVPILKKRGLRPQDYLGPTLRENLQLTAPDLNRPQGWTPTF